MSDSTHDLPDAIAVVGLATRFPGAADPETFWENLRAGRESLTVFTDEELRAAGIPEEVIANSAYVRTNGVLEGAEAFDADFFGMTPREAALTDPQHRVFLELAWTALERAGYDAARVPGPVGIFAGAGLSTYLLRNLMPNRELVSSAGELALLLGNNKDFVPTRASYKLNLRGPSINVNTACSTSLVATHLACQSLLDHHCDMALAGGVSVQVPQAQGYLYAEGGIGSPDGHCRAFDAAARGTVSGNGCGLVVLRRLADALADGDHIHAVIRGSAVNNDGADKAGFTAPSVTGQRDVIAEAQAVAEVDPAAVSYIEAHGTGTPLGDPIEIAALTEAFGAVPPGSCAIGSVKTNFGHLDEAAGIAGLTKTILALEHQELPASLHFATPNPRIGFSDTPFYVNHQLQPWVSPTGQPRLAGVSSFGLGGTNAHVVLSEAPARPAEAPSTAAELIVLSAKTTAALDQARQQLADWLKRHPNAHLANVAFTLANGRQEFTARLAIVATSPTAAATALTNPAVHSAADAAPDAVWIFSGQGSPYPGMLTGLYAAEPVVRSTIDQCAALLQPHLGCDLRELLAPDTPDVAERLKDTTFAQPAVFVADYALAQLWLSRGLEPAALIGHSLGEYVAACLAGVWSLADALKLVATRGALMAAQPRGAMLALGLSPQESAARATEYGLDLAAVNAPNASVLAGPVRAINQLAETLTAAGIAATPLETSHAFHSVMMEPMLDAFGECCASVTFHPPQRPIISGVSGKALTDAEATDPRYWVNHVRQPVRFADAIATARAELRNPVWLEVGPGRGLASMVKRNLEAAEADRVFTSTRHPSETLTDRHHLLQTAGQLWATGVPFDWPKWFADAPRRRVVLPTYPFQRQRHWIDAPPRESHVTAPTTGFSLAALTSLWESDESRWRADPHLVAHPKYSAFRAALDPWCAATVYRYITAPLPSAQPGEHHSLTDLVAALKIAPAFEKCLSFLLQLLAMQGYGSITPEGITWAKPPADGFTGDELRDHFPEFKGIVQLVEHCLSHYPAALSGEIPAITVLYPEGSSALLESTAAQNAPHTDKRVYLQLLRQTIEAKLAATSGRPLRLLEVGIGDGLLAGELAPALKGRGVEYVATDLSRAFVNKAKSKAKAAGLDFVTFEVLDISRDPISQGFIAGDYDVIVGLDVVHATPHLAVTLGHLRTLLAPGGYLGIVEKVGQEPWVDLVWGLAEGWWYFADTELRPWSPLMPADRWERVLAQLDFADIVVFPRNRESREQTDYALLLAQTATTPSIDIAPWFQAVRWTERTASPGNDPSGEHFAAADGLARFIEKITQWGADGQPRVITLQSDGAPAQEMLTGAMGAAAREFPQLTFRHMVRLPDGGSRARHLQPLNADEPMAFLRRDHGVYLITGAFGSMGRVFATELARSTGAKLVLVGRSQVDQTWVAQLENSGTPVLARTVDITDATALESVMTEVRERFGAINGVVHTAGVYGQGLMARRDSAAIAATLAPKVTGTLNLVAALSDAELDFLVLCSSVAAVAPEPGQCDYATANAFLDAFAFHHRRETGTPTLSVGWGVWQELGMMDHPDLPQAQKDAARAEIDREGWNHLGPNLVRHVLNRCGAESHVLISPTPVRVPQTPHYPLFHSRQDEPSGAVSFLAELDPHQHWVVNEHRLAGLALLPGTGFLELARAAYAELHDDVAIELAEVYFLSPLTFPENKTRKVHVVIIGDSFKVISQVSDDGWLEHTRGEIRSAPSTPVAAHLTGNFVPEPPAPDAVLFGPRWQCLRSVAFDGVSGVAQIELPAAHSDDAVTYPLHPALLDMAIGFITLRHGLPDSLPFCYRRLVIHRALPTKFRSEVRVVAQSEDDLELAAQLFDEQDTLLVSVEGYRLRRSSPRAPTRPPDQARLSIRSQHTGNPLQLIPSHRREPSAHEVEIEIAAAGLNFIEVLYAHGMLPASPALEESFGLECAGRIVRIGTDVTEFAVDDEVIAYANGCFANYLTVRAGAVAKCPAGLTAAAAATLPGAYATAHYALITQARLCPGEKVLIHAAAGGVGLAAVRVAQSVGAEIYATAGSPEKRKFLQALGVPHVMDSRSTEFATEVTRLTRGTGVDVVLNSLSGELLRASLGLVAPRGRFVELGKRDLQAGQTLDLGDFARIISFIVIDVGPDLPDFDELWQAVTTRFRDGTYPALPYKSFDLVDPAPAFAYMAQAKHIGKIVLTPGQATILLHHAHELAPVGQPLARFLATSLAPDPAGQSTAARPKTSTAALPMINPGEGDEIARTITAIWQELLGVDAIGPEDDFFSLRGDSLLAAQVMARIQAALTVKLPLSSIFDRPTVAGLSNRVRELQGDAASLGDDEEEGEL
ncbi:MAG: SDR family NAD(P)-dependent oxidoreductase [bacterium]